MLLLKVLIAKEIATLPLSLGLTCEEFFSGTELGKASLSFLLYHLIQSLQH